MQMLLIKMHLTQDDMQMILIKMHLTHVTD